MSTEPIPVRLVGPVMFHERWQRRCQGAKRYALRCKREGEPNPDDGLYLCHDHEDQRETWNSYITFDETNDPSGTWGTVER